MTLMFAWSRSIYRNTAKASIVCSEKYKSQIEIHLGLEAEFFPHHMQELMDLKAENHIEYLIFGAHYDELDEPIPERFYFGRDCLTPQDLERYENNIIPGIESKFYAYVAHPDLFIRSYPYFDKHCEALSHRICETAMRCGAILEYNISGSFTHRSINE